MVRGRVVSLPPKVKGLSKLALHDISDTGRVYMCYDLVVLLSVYLYPTLICTTAVSTRIRTLLRL